MIIIVVLFLLKLKKYFWFFSPASGLLFLLFLLCLRLFTFDQFLGISTVDICIYFGSCFIFIGMLFFLWGVLGYVSIISRGAAYIGEPEKTLAPIELDGDFLRANIRLSDDCKICLFGKDIKRKQLEILVARDKKLWDLLGLQIHCSREDIEKAFDEIERGMDVLLLTQSLQLARRILVKQIKNKLFSDEEFKNCIENASKNVCSKNLNYKKFGFLFWITTDLPAQYLRDVLMKNFLERDNSCRTHGEEGYFHIKYRTFLIDCFTEYYGLGEFGKGEDDEKKEPLIEYVNVADIADLHGVFKKIREKAPIFECPTKKLMNRKFLARKFKSEVHGCPKELITGNLLIYDNLNTLAEINWRNIEDLLQYIQHSSKIDSMSGYTTIYLLRLDENEEKHKNEIYMKVVPYMDVIIDIRGYERSFLT